MPRPMSSDCVCSLKAMMAFHARHRSTVFAIYGLWWYATPDVIRPCVLPNVDDCMPRTTSFDRVCCTKVMSCPA